MSTLYTKTSWCIRCYLFVLILVHFTVRYKCFIFVTWTKTALSWLLIFLPLNSIGRVTWIGTMKLAKHWMGVMTVIALMSDTHDVIIIIRVTASIIHWIRCHHGAMNYRSDFLNLVIDLPSTVLVIAISISKCGTNRPYQAWNRYSLIDQTWNVR